jgi:hypothetical protein
VYIRKINKLKFNKYDTDRQHYFNNRRSERNRPGLTERFLKEGNKVIICGRRKDTLQEASNKFPSVITKVCDLSVEAERNALYNWF